MSKILTVDIHLPALHCDWCGEFLYPDGFNEKRVLDVIGIHRIANHFNQPNPQFELTGFSQQDLENQAQEAGWKFLEIYGRRFNACPKCQQKGTKETGETE